MDNFIAAKQLISYLDLTSLSEKDTDYSIADLCQFNEYQRRIQQ